jgi:hypothetical protein
LLWEERERGECHNGKYDRNIYGEKSGSGDSPGSEITPQITLRVLKCREGEWGGEGSRFCNCLQKGSGIGFAVKTTEWSEGRRGKGRKEGEIVCDNAELVSESTVGIVWGRQFLLYLMMKKMKKKLIAMMKTKKNSYAETQTHPNLYVKAIENDPHFDKYNPFLLSPVQNNALCVTLMGVVVRWVSWDSLHFSLLLLVVCGVRSHFV